MKEEMMEKKKATTMEMDEEEWWSAKTHKKYSIGEEIVERRDRGI